MDWSSASLHCRIDWRPSRLQATLLIALGLLAAVALWLSALPAVLAVAGGALLPLLAALQAWTGLRRPPCVLDWDASGQGPAHCHRDDEALVLDGLTMQRRGWLLVLQLRRDGRTERLACWPDSVSPADARTLRLHLAATPRTPGASALLAG